MYLHVVPRVFCLCYSPEGFDKKIKDFVYSPFKTLTCKILIY